MTRYTKIEEKNYTAELASMQFQAAVFAFPSLQIIKDFYKTYFIYMFLKQENLKWMIKNSKGSYIEKFQYSKKIFN